MGGGENTAFSISCSVILDNENTSNRTIDARIKEILEI